jgi:hypothetical protein
MSGCSKAPRGLFALPRVTCIFTGTSISPDPSLRQRPDRYAIRAGRNLPDKEFRYLRTVIVTAAVYRGFDSELAPLLLTFRHWAGVSPYTSAFAFAETCVFAKQSPGPFHCGFDRPLQAAAAKRPFSRSYGAMLPSSLTRVLPIALVFSTRLPVSDCGTDTVRLARHFSRQHGSLDFRLGPSSSLLGVETERTDLPVLSPYRLERTYPKRARATTPCHALAPTWDQIPDSTGLRQPTSVLLPPGDTLRCKRLPVVPEYQPDVHRLRLSSSA